MSEQLTNDMSVGNPAKKLFFFTVPIVLGNLFQQLYNIIDSMVVGRFVGAQALAAVGASTAIVFLFVAVATGSSIGYSVVISQLFGAKDYDRMMTAIYTALISTFVLGFVLMIIGAAGTEGILVLMRTPADIYQDAADYLRIYMLGLVFLFMYNTLNAVYNSLGASKIPLYFLAGSSVLNIVLDLYFVIRLGMGVTGVAWATLIAQGLAAVISFINLLFRLKTVKTEKKPVLFSHSILLQMGRIAVPSMVQQSIVSFGMVFVQSLVNSFGSVVLAGYTAATKIDSIAIMPMVNVGNAVSTFTAQNIGAKKPERIREGLKAGRMMAAGIALAITAVLFFKGDVLVAQFVDKTVNAQVIAVGVDYLRVVSVFYALMGLMNVVNAVLRGAGDVGVFMAGTLCNFGCRVAFAYILAHFLGASGIWWSIPIGWAVAFMIGTVRYRSGKWKDKGVIE
ncbi:MATE family efflux transporter [Anaerostipes sp.]|uniref:MATE family efflux transporter n=1 Tax=Anaerostipes sp. TaxID=1872530 RepID=UPI0025C06EB2|nr:MATE family efflux transporter [Anaerostipes sp.]MBS7009903.1 MATE family efflux transporter [Anaerostipes sp.]